MIIFAAGNKYKKCKAVLEADEASFKVALQQLIEQLEYELDASYFK